MFRLILACTGFAVVVGIGTAEISRYHMKKHDEEIVRELKKKLRDDIRIRDEMVDKINTRLSNNLINLERNAEPNCGGYDHMGSECSHSCESCDGEYHDFGFSCGHSWFSKK